MFSLNNVTNSGKDLFTVGSFNVRGLSSQSKRSSLRRDLAAYKIDVCTLQETKIQNGLDEHNEGYRLICLPSECRHYGLGFAISSRLVNNISRFWKISDRVAVLVLSFENNSKKSQIAIVGVYAPTTARCESNPDEIDSFYSHLSQAVDTVSRSSLLFISGDFNAKVGVRSNNELSLGSHGRGRRNNSGQALVDFCGINNFFVANTAFQHSARHITTWVGSRRDTSSGSVVPIYNQIDYVICRQSQKRLLVDSRTFSGCHTQSDHRLLVARLQLGRFYGIMHRDKCRSKMEPKLDMSRLATDSQLREQYQAELQEQLSRNTVNSVDTSANTVLAGDKWEFVKAGISSASRKVLPVMPKKNHRQHDPQIAEMSLQQRDLRLRIANTIGDEKKQQLKRDRNQILHQIRKRALQVSEDRLNRQAEEVERLKDGAMMFKAVQLMKRSTAKKATVADDTGKRIGNDKEAAEAIAQHFSSQFHSANDITLLPFTGNPSPLTKPITSAECTISLKHLNNGRAAGNDDISGELLKYGVDVLAPYIADILNSMLVGHEPLDLGEGVLIPLQKPGKPLGPPANLRPIMLLSTLRKTLSLIVLRRISEAVNLYLAPCHSGFRTKRSTADVVWSHRWLAAKCQKYQTTIEILGIDMSKAFDSIRRDKLMTVLATFLGSDELRMIQVLLSNTNFTVRLGQQSSSIYSTNIGTPQGDSLSPVLFIVYLEAALRQVRHESPPRPPADTSLPVELAYADDVDLVSTSQQWLDEVEVTMVRVLAEWSLKVNPDKTERTTLVRQPDRADEAWRGCKKLGSLIGDAEDIQRRKQLASLTFSSMCNTWKRRDKISEKTRLRLYSAFVLPVLLYNSGTWGTTEATMESLDAFHRRQLRSLLNIKWPNSIPNSVLYERCKTEPISYKVKASRWRLFGHILRLPPATPAVLSMQAYFAGQSLPCWRGRPRSTLPVVLSKDLKSSGQGTLANSNDLHRLHTIAMDRAQWRQLYNGIVK